MTWLEAFKECFGHHAQHLALRRYVQGLLSDSARKSMEAMLARVMQEELTDGEVLQVNSRHHQAVGKAAEGFMISATAPDGVVEAIERPGSRFCVGVQWHPENFWRTGEFRSLFEEFVKAAESQ